jgi:hypothetical protein
LKRVNAAVFAGRTYSFSTTTDGSANHDRWRAHNSVILGYHDHPIEERRLDRLLPGPERQREVGERPVIGVED